MSNSVVTVFLSICKKILNNSASWSSSSFCNALEAPSLIRVFIHSLTQIMRRFAASFARRFFIVVAKTVRSCCLPPFLKVYIGLVQSLKNPRMHMSQQVS